jgi:hypothetical protein
VKISRIAEAVPFLNRVREKADSGDHPGGEQRQSQKDARDEQADAQSGRREFDEKLVGAAVEAFRSDTHARAQGLQADVNGSGPGLRVVLRDGNGAVVRQFTGEEFVQLRQAASSSGGDLRHRGKLLDRKL